MSASVDDIGLMRRLAAVGNSECKYTNDNDGQVNGIMMRATIRIMNT